VNLVNSQPSVEESRVQQSSVIAQAMKQSGLVEDEVPDEDDEEDEVVQFNFFVHNWKCSC